MIIVSAIRKKNIPTKKIRDTFLLFLRVIVGSTNAIGRILISTGLKPVYQLGVDHRFGHRSHPLREVVFRKDAKCGRNDDQIPVKIIICDRNGNERLPNDERKTSVIKIDQRENLIRRYLLGELAEADQAALEQELLSDRGKFDQVWAVENELVDSFVRGEMSRPDRQRFENHYIASPLHRERVAIAESFLTDIDQAVGETVEVREKESLVPWRRRFPLRSPRPVFGVVLVIAFLLTFSLVWSYIERVRLTGQIANAQKEAQTERTLLKQRERELASQNQEFEKEIADVSRRNEQLKADLEQLRLRQTAPPTVLSFMLTPAPIRSEKAPPQSTIPLSAGKAQLLMELDDNDYANYQAVLQTVEGREILRRLTGKVRFSKDRAFVTLPVEAGELTRGDYIIVLFGQTADGRSEEIDRYFFRVL